MTVSSSRTIVERVRLTGTGEEVHAATRNYQARGFRMVEQNPLKIPGRPIDLDRIGITLERPHHYLRYGGRLWNYK